MIFSYKVKVFSPQERPSTNIWGGNDLIGVERTNLGLVCQLDVDSESIKLVKILTAGETISLGTLNPGETYLVSLENVKTISAVCANPNVDTSLMCAVVGMN